MPLRFFADHCVATSTINTFRSAGHEVLRLGDYLPTDAPDDEVIDCAQQHDAILLTLNGDFCDIVRFPPAQYKGIFAMQVKNHPVVTQHIAEHILLYTEQYPDDVHYVGKLFIVDVIRIRIRH